MSSNPSKKKPSRTGDSGEKPTGTRRSDEKPTGTVKSSATRPGPASKNILLSWGNVMEDELMYNNEKILLEPALEMRPLINRLDGLKNKWLEDEIRKLKEEKTRDEEQLNSKSEEIVSLRKELETLKMALSKQNSTDQQAQGRNTNFEKELKEKDESIFNQYGEQPGSEQFKMPTSQILPSVSDSFTESMSALSVRGPGDDDSFIVADDTERLAEASFAGDSDERIKIPCAVCFTNRNYSKEATHFCGECGLLGYFLCEQCLSFHKKFSPHKDVKSFAAAKYMMRYA